MPPKWQRSSSAPVEPPNHTNLGVHNNTHTHTLIPMHFKLTCGLHLSVHLWTSLLTFSFVLTVCGFFCWTLEVFSSRFVSKQNFCFKLKVINLQLKSIFSVISLSSHSWKPQIFNFMTNDWNWKIFTCNTYFATCSLDPDLFYMFDADRRINTNILVSDDLFMINVLDDLSVRLWTTSVFVWFNSQELQVNSSHMTWIFFCRLRSPKWSKT